MKGYITQQHTVWCGTCNTWDQLSGSKTYCKNVFKRDGWVNRKEKGWLCPTCKKDLGISLATDKAKEIIKRDTKQNFNIKFW